jgi:hypothetical protein
VLSSDDKEGEMADAEPRSRRVVPFFVGMSLAFLVTGNLLFPASEEIHVPQDRLVAGWQEATRQGNHQGPEDGAPSVLVFGDYTSETFRMIDGALQRVRASPIGADIVVSFRHRPLSPIGYYASRIVECGAVQDGFEGVHRAVLNSESLEALHPGAFFASAGIPDSTAFVDCISDQTLVSNIERDIRAGNQMGLRAGASLLLNGILLGFIPDSTQLADQLHTRLVGHHSVVSGH